MATPPEELVFTVRMWVQAGESSGDGEWRGSIVDVKSGRKFYVSGMRDVADFIGARIAERKSSGREPG